MRILLAGGGTGGHIYPAMALAEAVQAEGDHAVSFIGDPNGLEAELLPRGGFTFAPVPVERLSGSTIGRLLPVLRSLVRAVPMTCRLIENMAADAVVATGGYVSACAILAGYRLGIPVLVIELNSVPGRTVRWLSRFMTGIALQFPSAMEYLPVPKCRITGIPVRTGILSANRKACRSDLGLDDDQPCVVVFGGSRAALRINRAVCSGVSRLLQGHASVTLLHLTGVRDFDEAQVARVALPEVLRGRYIVREYAHDMGSVYACADLVVCRAGGSSIAELTARGLPSLLIPYPYATDQHQLRNAEELSAHGATAYYHDDSFDGDAFVTGVLSLLGRPQRVQEMAAAAFRWGRRDATHRILRWLEEWVSS